MKKKKFRRSKKPLDPRITPKKKYFTKDTQAAIYEFCNSQNNGERAKVYESRIQPALMKLTENLIYIYGFHKCGEQPAHLQQACVVALYETLHKFDHTRGTNAFSYFNVVAKNWLIIQSRRRKKRTDRLVYIDDDNLSIADKYAIEEYSIAPSPERAIDLQEQLADMKSLLTEIKNIAKNDQERKCVDAIIQIFDNVDSLDYLNKRALFVYVRELSGLTSKQLSVCMSNLRKVYRGLVGPDKKYDIF